MSQELTDAIANSDYLLGHALPHFEAGRLCGLKQVLGFATLYRRRGTAQLLLQGLVEPLFVGQMQSAAAYLHGLARVPPDERVTSEAACLWDAIAGEYWDAAQEIANHSRRTHNAKREHEDDFLYVDFLLHRYFLAPDEDAPPTEHTAHEEAQAQRLERWEEVLEGGLDLRLDLCHALAAADLVAFEEAIVGIAGQRDERLADRLRTGTLTKEDMTWLQPVWSEGIALLRLAQRDGLAVEGMTAPRVPPITTSHNPFDFNAGAWRSVGFQPTKRG